MSVVIDASATLGWIYLDEMTPLATQIFQRVADFGAWVPSIWPVEVANGLQMGVRRQRIGAAFRDAALADLAALNIAVDPSTGAMAWTTTLQLADRFGLTVYDAAYLELAQRRALPLASLDAPLCAAARELGVPVVGD